MSMKPEDWEHLGIKLEKSFKQVIFDETSRRGGSLRELRGGEGFQDRRDTEPVSTLLERI